jgi:hypothetical protein
VAKPKSSAALSPNEIELLLASIATDHLFIETLETQKSGRLDFNDVSVWGVKSASQAADDARLRVVGGPPERAVIGTRKAPGTSQANGSGSARRA